MGDNTDRKKTSSMHIFPFWQVDEQSRAGLGWVGLEVRRRDSSEVLDGRSQAEPGLQQGAKEVIPACSLVDSACGSSF